MEIALFSIKPIFAQSILLGTKCFEFRLKRCKKDIEKIVIYETSPVCKITGEVSVYQIIEDSPQNLWLMAQDKAGIKFKDFMDYYNNKESGVAYCLFEPLSFKAPLGIEQIGIKYVPQSFIYLNQDSYNCLQRIVR